ncbi:carbohydrate ABC transporter permease [Lachnospiraceae bacterium 54-11]
MKNTKNIPVYIILFLFCLIAVFPFIWAGIAATHTNTQIYQIEWSFRIGEHMKQNAADLKAAFPVVRNMCNSLIIAFGYTAGILIIDSMAGFAFAKYEFKGKKVIFALTLGSMFIPGQVTLIPLFIEMTSFRMINTNWAVILPGFAAVFGVFLMRQQFIGFPNELLDAAHIDGAGDFRIFLQIVMPAMKPALTSLGILSFVNQWGNFMWPLIVLNSKEKYTMPLILSLMVQPGYVTNYGAVMFGAMLALIPVLAFFLIFQKNFIDGMLSGAVKG